MLMRLDANGPAPVVGAARVWSGCKSAVPLAVLRFAASAETTLFKGEGRATSYDDVYVLDGRRTPFGDYAGALKNLSATELAVSATTGLLAVSGIKPEEIDDSLWGNIIPSSNNAPYLARHAALQAGASYGSLATGINKLCGSGLMVTDLAARILGDVNNADKDDCIILAGGAESMSRSPFASYEFMSQLVSAGKQVQQAKNPVAKVLPALRYLWTVRKLRGNFAQDMDRLVKGREATSPSRFTNTLRAGLTDSLAPAGMLDTAENLRELFRIAQEELDAYSELSQHRTADAVARGAFDDELVPVRTPDGRSLLAVDQAPRGFAVKATSIAKLRQRQDKNGTLGANHLNPEKAVHTAANASGIVDGAAAMLITNAETAHRWSVRTGKKPLGKIIATAEVGVDPSIMGYGAAKAAKLALQKSGLKFQDIDLFEVNEAFASVALAAMKDWEATYKLPLKDIMLKTNVNGGAIAIGHPLAASGVRLTITMLKELQRRNLRYGLVTACIGGGQGMAMIVENTSFQPKERNGFRKASGPDKALPVGLH